MKRLLKIILTILAGGFILFGLVQLTPFLRHSFIAFTSFIPMGNTHSPQPYRSGGQPSNPALPASTPTQSNPDKLDPTTLEKFVDPLPVPAAAKSTGQLNGRDLYEIAMTQFKQKLHRDLPETTVWGYGGTYPGPTIEAKKDVPIYVKWINNLPSSHLLPIDKTVHGAMDAPDVRVVVHLHGGHVPDKSDGYPEDWFTPGNSLTDYYPNNQLATTLWYHDHAMGITRLNVEAGLAGFYLVRDSQEDKYNLPSGNYEIPVVIQDRSFNKDGSLDYPNQGITDSHPIWVPESFGDTAVVNGKVWPYLEVEPRKYRFRLLNGSNARFYHLKLSSGQSFYQIGSDGGLLPYPVRLKDLLLAPAERADIVVDFSGQQGKKIILTNDAQAPYPGPGDGPALPQIMQFRVKNMQVNDTSRIPYRFDRIHSLSPAMIKQTRSLTLEEVVDSHDSPIESLLDGKHWTDPVTENPKLGDTEMWQFINLTPDAHPIHLHLVQFQVLSRIPFNAEKYKADKENGNLKALSSYYTGRPQSPPPNETGWKDTVKAYPNYITRIIIRFDDYTGRYVWHCHILEHEDNDMMRPFEVTR